MARKSKRRKERLARKRAESHEHDADVVGSSSVDNGDISVDSSNSGKGVTESGNRYLHFNPEDWSGPDGDLGVYIRDEVSKTMRSYASQPNLIKEHANTEEDSARGGYANRQIMELVQNGADALSGSQTGGRLDVVLTDTHLYCADDGDPIDMAGVTALMFSHISPKRGTSEIGRFGLGFKSVLGVTDSPEFISRSVSFRFSNSGAKRRLVNISSHEDRYPVLRTPEPIDACKLAESDSDLAHLMSWCNNVVRLPLKDRAVDRVRDQIDDFAPEFLLFVPHVHRLDLRDLVDDVERSFTLDERDGVFVLSSEEGKGHWRLFSHMHRLSGDAKADRRALDDAEEVPIWWAAPIDGSHFGGYSYEVGDFWAFSPTRTRSLLSGILNAPWKTSEDRSVLLSGIYNDELILGAAEMVADALPNLSTPDDPAKHLDVLPRRQRSAEEEHTILLGDELFRMLYKRALLPDQQGNLKRFDQLRYPPSVLMRRRTEYDRDLEAAIEMWHSVPDLPVGWIHRSALRTSRWPFVGRLCDPEGKLFTDGGVGVPETSLEAWLGALIHGKMDSVSSSVEASKVAVQTAALIPGVLRGGNELGNIVFTKDGKWRSPSHDNLYLPSEEYSSVRGMTEVHPDVAFDPETRSALETLGIKEASDDTRFARHVRLFAEHAKDTDIPSSDKVWKLFWSSAGKADMGFAESTIRSQSDWRGFLKVRTASGNWNHIYSVLFPGDIVPADGSRDSDVALDTVYHSDHMDLLERLGLTDLPHVRRGIDVENEPLYSQYLRISRDQYLAHDDLPANPRESYLVFRTDIGVSPIEVLSELSEEGGVLYTDALLSFDVIYKKWEMAHDTSDRYPVVEFDSPAIWMLREHGMIKTQRGIVGLRDVLQEPEMYRDAVRLLLKHKNGEKIREAFDLKVPEIYNLTRYGESDPIPLTDEWPGLENHLLSDQDGLMLIRCSEILADGEFSKVSDSFRMSRDERHIYLVDGGDGVSDLSSVSDTLELYLSKEDISEILRATRAQDIERRMAIIARLDSDAERLLAAVGERALRQRLPQSLLSVLETNGALSGVEVAEAAISTYHTAALSEYRHALKDLDPPQQWAGTPRAVSFVTSLGFSPEWAGERSLRRDPFIEVMGPYSLPALHDYQQIIAARLRQMLRSDALDSDKRRGMISLPTGSGKTRVAVQGIVESMRDDDFAGGVLWVADRDELCEQAVESWQQVWASLGSEAESLRISRMWAGQPAPVPTSDLHVVVASIQSLYSKLNSRSSEHDFLRDFKLVVFDEAHRSIAPTFTSAMEDIGFTRRQGAGEPFLLGLTATPYRGHNEDETRWLTNRYGRNRLDDGAFPSDDPNDVILELQRMQVLARAEHEEIEGGMFGLTREEVQQAEATPWLPRSAEERLAQDPDRTERILDAYQEHVDGDWATLIFATSVEHAQTLSALLNSRGVKARAVSGSTDRTTRRRVVEEFRNGDIKVLVNYGVFREGFDAPKTRAIIVARPVYSPNLYFQMIGRGLRGIKNGGNDRCLILNVQDNIENFERKLAFTELDWLWDGG